MQAHRFPTLGLGHGILIEIKLSTIRNLTSASYAICLLKGYWAYQYELM